jgi:hypothetical protein
MDGGMVRIRAEGRKVETFQSICNCKNDFRCRISSCPCTRCFDMYIFYRKKDTPSERRITERRITERRITERRISERRITERRIIERRKLLNAELANVENYRTSN